MKLISLNVALAEKNNEQLSQFITSQNPDILALQEVTKRVEHCAYSDLISKDAIDQASPQLPHSFYAPNWVLSRFEKPDFHGKKHYVLNLGGNVEFGNYIRTRYTITKGQAIFVQNHFSYITDWSNWPEEDYRAYQVVDLLIEDKKVRIINYHGVWTRNKLGNDDAFRACEMIKNTALEVNYPVIIAGDFNLFPHTPSIELLNNSFNNLSNSYNIKTTRPKSNELNHLERNVVDYIFVSKNVFVKSFEVVPSDISDHLPLILDFEIT